MTLNNPCSLTSPLSVSLTFSSSQQEISTHHMLNPLPWNHCWTFWLCQPNFSTLPSRGVLQHLISVVYFFPVYLPKPKVFKFYVYCSVFQNLILFFNGWWYFLMCIHYILCIHLGCVISTTLASCLDCLLLLRLTMGREDEAPCLRSPNVYFIYPSNLLVLSQAGP